MSELQVPNQAGFTFHPTVRRMKEYRLLEGGYTGATFNLSYGKAAGSCVSYLNNMYILKGYHSASSWLEF